MGIFTNCVRLRMVGKIWSSFSATKINKVFAGGSSISFKSLLPSLPKYSGIHSISILYSLSKLFKLSFRKISLHSCAVIFPCLFSALINCSQSYTLPYGLSFTNSLHWVIKSVAMGLSPVLRGITG